MKLTSVLAMWFRSREARNTPGSDAWLIQRERMYGGMTSGVVRRRVSTLDPRSHEELSHTTMTGGDRMHPANHGYGRIYAKYLRSFVQSTANVTLVEVGILKGTGLAVWSDLFPKGRIIGLDLDLSHFFENLQWLRDAGAFSADNCSVYEFDGFEKNSDLRCILSENSERIDIVIDDASHIDEAIVATFDSFRPHLANNFVYFVEDNKNVWKVLKTRYPQYKIRSLRHMTVICPRPRAS